MAEETRTQNNAKTTTPGEVDERALRNPTLAPQCPAIPNQTGWLVRKRYTRYQRRQTYHYHHAP